MKSGLSEQFRQPRFFLYSKQVFFNRMPIDFSKVADAFSQGRFCFFACPQGEGR